MDADSSHHHPAAAEDERVLDLRDGAPGAEQPGLGGDYWRFLVGAAASNLGDGIRLAALPLLAVELTTSALLVSGVAAATMLPWLLGPLAGALVDRLDRRSVVVAGQLGRAAVGLGFVALLLAGGESITALYLVAVLLGVGEVVVDTASQAVVPQLVPDRLLERGNARMITAQLVLDQMVGAALGGILFALARPLPFAVDAATFLVGAAVVATIRRPLTPRQPGAAAGRVVDDVRDGIRFLWDHRVLRGLALAVAVANIAMTTGTSVLVILVVGPDELAASEATFGVVLAAGAVGGLVGSLVAERLVRRLGVRTVMVVAPLGQVAGLLVVAAAPDVVVVALGITLMYVAITVYNVPGQSLRQRVTPTELLGRVVASFRMVGLAGVPLGALLGGLVTEARGVRAAFVTAGVLSIGTLVAVVRSTTDIEAAVSAVGSNVPRSTQPED